MHLPIQFISINYQHMH
ncbi:hypothetical protein F383_08978 [Gossypium arboreum]|uniref:Uncharacterized protein n=1 Tax=Gossypium arboreum TaxID=29729 RepID=A0A0B0NMQ0_GOSAR|nr:hypothetical protein F383_08978 [Gossypium arboreum]